MTQWLLILLTFNASGLTSSMTAIPFHSEEACAKAQKAVEIAETLRQQRPPTKDSSSVICVEG